MKNILRNNGDTFIIERSSMKVKAPDDWPKNRKYVVIRIDADVRPILLEYKESVFSHMPGERWKQYHTGDDPAADAKIHKIADYWGIEL